MFSPELLNSFRIAFGTNYQRLSSVNDQPLVIVQGAFSNGGAEVNEWRQEPRTDVLDTVSYSKGPNSWKLGVDAKFHPFRTYNADNFGGTYTFASLADYEAQQPTLFTITTGNPLLTFHQNDYAWFAQYERKIGNASLFAGVRHEFQSGMSRYGNLAPRVAAAFAPGKDHRTVIRIGAGIFYDRRPPPVLEQSLRFNGLQTQQYILDNPQYPVADPTGLGSLLPTALWRIDPEPCISANLSGKRDDRAPASGRLRARHGLYVSARRSSLPGTRHQCAPARHRPVVIPEPGFHRPDRVIGVFARKHRQLDPEKPAQSPVSVLCAVHALPALR